VISLARPQATLNLPRVEGTVILTFDVSGSMAADDLKPTRMEAAKTAAREFVGNQPASVLIGVVAFSDGGISVQAPTADREETLATIERLVPRRGTSVGNGILVSLNTIAVDAGDAPILSANNLTAPQAPAAPPQGWYTSAVIVLLSDGENNEDPDPMLAADLAADLGVRIYTVGIGSAAGALLDIEGFTVHSQLNEPMLQEISNITGGEYYNAGNEEELRRIYNDLEPKLSIKPEEMEVTSIFAGFAILVFLVGGALSLLWFGRVL
jgi:Ca-activated chloride channel family protein